MALRLRGRRPLRSARTDFPPPGRDGARPRLWPRHRARI